MGRQVLGMLVALLLMGVNGFAADGDLYVNGKVGIGTTTPGAKLSVNGDLQVPITSIWCNYGVNPGNNYCSCPAGYYPLSCGTNHYAPITLLISGDSCYSEQGGGYSDTGSAVVVQCAMVHN